MGGPDGNPLCVIHSDQLKDLWICVRGNGNPENGLMFKTALIIERQKSVVDFIEAIKKKFWQGFWTVMLAAASVIAKIIVIPGCVEIWKMISTHRA